MTRCMKVENYLERFVAEFVILFEEYFSEYYLCLLKKIPEKGDWSRMVERISCMAINVDRDSVIKLERTVWVIGVIQKMVRSVGVSYDEEKLRNVASILAELEKSPIRIRQTLLESAATIFQSFEYQLMQVESSAQHWCDFDKIVHDAVNRVINYYQQNPGTEFKCSSITTAVILGESKHYHGNFLRRGHTVTVNRTRVSTKDFFEKTGLKRGGGGCYCNSQTDLSLGYRLAFDWEHSKVLCYLNAERGTQEQYKYFVDQQMISRVVRQVSEDIYAGLETGKFDRALHKISRDAKRDAYRLWCLIKNSCCEVLTSIDSLIAEYHAIDNSKMTKMANYARVEKYLKRFVTEFVILFEKYFAKYYHCLLEKISKKGEWSIMVERLSRMARSVERNTVFKLEETVWIIGVIQKMVHSVGVCYDKEKLRNVTVILAELKKHPCRIRQTLLESAAIIFQSFEYQFVQVEFSAQNWCDFDKIVHEAVNRVINYYQQHPGTEFKCSSITTAVILGKSKHYHGHFSPRGHSVEVNRTRVNTKDLFEKTGLERGGGGCYCNSQTDLSLGYRLAFDWEQSNELCYLNSEKGTHEQYQYCTDQEMISRVVKQVSEDIYASLETSEFDGALQRISQDAESDATRLWRLIENNFCEVMTVIDNLPQEFCGTDDSVITINLNTLGNIYRDEQTNTKKS